MFHDPLAGANIFEPDICTYRRGRVSVELARGEHFGDTVFAEDAGGPHVVAEKVDAPRFFKRYFGITGVFAGKA
jgi:purine nucleosidase